MAVDLERRSQDSRTFQKTNTFEHSLSFPIDTFLLLFCDLEGDLYECICLIRTMDRIGGLKHRSRCQPFWVLQVAGVGFV